MKINEIYIKAFGKLRGIKISPVSGLNIIFGENECGKSTVMAFVLGMFYGLGKGEERRRYDPWEGGRMAGIIGFSHGGKTYVLSRRFGATRSADTVELWCTDSGEQVTLPSGKEPGEFLLGINKETFLNSVYIGQAGTPIQGDNSEILQKLMNLAASGDETACHADILERLANGMAQLRSRRSSALIPALEKERQALLEERSGIQQAVQSAEQIRDSHGETRREEKQVEDKIARLEKQIEIAKEAGRLAGYDEIIAKHDELQETREKYEKLHDALFGGGKELSGSFIENAREQMEEYRRQEGVIAAKKEQLEETLRKLEAVDRSPLENVRIIKNHRDEIDKAYQNYSEMRAEKNRIERGMEHDRPQNDPQKKQKEKMTNDVLTIGLLVSIGFCLLGFWKPLQPFMFLAGGVIAVCVLAYWIIQRKGHKLAGVRGTAAELENIQQDMRALNREMRTILNQLGLGSMGEIEALQQEIGRTYSAIERCELERDKLKAEIGSLEEEQAANLSILKEKLSAYKPVETDAEALKIISALDRAIRDHFELETVYSAASELLEKLLGGQDYDTVYLEAEELRGRLGDIQPLKDDDYIKLEREILGARDAREELLRRRVKLDTELELQQADSQSLTEISNKIKELNQKIDRLEFEYDSMKIAYECIEEAFSSMQKDFGPIINFRASKIVERLTGGAYKSVLISERLVPAVSDGASSDIRSAASLSGGTVDQIYLALRLAISGVLTGEALPVLLDDAFAQYDDSRAALALLYLKEQPENEIPQVILFTCHDRVLHLARELGLEGSIVKL